MSFLTDLRYTFRQITNNPGFFALAVAALALGVGANTAIFSAVEAVLLRPLPYSQPDRLVVVWEDASNVGQPEQLSGKKVTPNFFDVLGVQPVVSYVRTMDQMMETDGADRTRPMILLGVFAGLALMLACIGVYGVLAYAVAERTREIGVRMALGAKPGDVTRMILERGMKLSAMGLLAGGALAAGLAVLLRTLLFGVTMVAPGIYAGTAAALVLVAMVACVIPAQRAARLDPAVALRNE
jgi:hypothetical protein